MLTRLRREFTKAEISAIEPGQNRRSQIDLDARTCNTAAA
jgi:hypothetical protein